MRITVLGCGTSAGVPQIGCQCPVCRSTDPRDRRLRAAILVEAQGQRILFDTGPDLREQCLAAGIATIDALIYTHAHADHTHGIDDLRALNNNMMATILAHGAPVVLKHIEDRFPYAFLGGRSEMGYWRPDVTPVPFHGGFAIGPVQVTPFSQRHGRGETWGFRIGDFAYSTDTDDLDERAFEILAGIRVWIVDALRDRPHPSHAHLSRTLEWIARVGPEQAYLTHMNHDVSYADWARRLPPGVLPAHDGLRIELP